MERKITMAVVFVAALFLSGCNLNTGTTNTSSSHEGNAMVAEETPSAPAKPAMAETVSYQAGAIQTFDQQKFDAALADGKTVFLDYYASWCPTCRANKPIVDAAFAGTDVVAFRVDYDSATDLRKKYSVTSQSTYIVFKGGQETDRYLGSLTSGRIDDLLDL